MEGGKSRLLRWERSHSASLLPLLAGDTHLLTHDAASASCGVSVDFLFEVLFPSRVPGKPLVKAMAEVAGLVLGAIPLIFLALDKYEQCLKFGKNYRNYADTLMSIRDEVFVQQKLFLGTMETLGLHNPTYSELEDCLRNSFPESHTTVMRYIRRMATTIDQLMAKLEVDARGEVSKIELAGRILLISFRAAR